MGVTPPLRYIHIDDYSPVGIENGPDDLAFANARADLAATGYTKLVIGPGQYWLQNGFNLNQYSDYNGVNYPQLNNILITSDSFASGGTTKDRVYCGLPATIVLSPGFADPTVGAYVGGSEPCRTTGSIILPTSCSMSNLRIMSLSAYQYSILAAVGLDSLAFANNLVTGYQSGMAAPVGAAMGMEGVTAGGGTAIQVDGNYCSIENVVIMGFRNSIVCTPPSSTGSCASGLLVGKLQCDAANGVRIDNCKQAGAIVGPISQSSFLTSSLSKDTIQGTISADGSGNVSVTMSSTTVEDLVPGTPVKILLSVANFVNSKVIPTGGCYNSCNTSNLTPSGNPSNRYDGVFMGLSGSAGGTATISLPGISLSSFFDETCNATAYGIGTISGTSLSVSLTSGMLSPGQYVLGTSVPNQTMIASVNPSSTGTTICVLTSSSTVSTPEALTMVSGQSVSGSIVTGAHGFGVPVFDVSSSGSIIEPGMLVASPTLTPGTTISGTSAITPVSGTLSVPQLVAPSVVTAFNGAIIDGSVSSSTLTVNSTTIGNVAIGQLLTGPGISGVATITSHSSGVWGLSSGAADGIQNETLNLITSPSLGTMSALSTTGTITTATLSGGSLTNGQALYAPNLLPGSFVSAGGGSSSCTVSVVQAVGTPTEPVPIAAQPGILFVGSIATSTGTTSSLVVTSTILGGTLSIGTPIVGPGIQSNTYIASAGSGSPSVTYSLNNSQGAISEQILFAPEAVAKISSISGTVLTVLSSPAMSAVTLSAGSVLAGSGILPGTSITNVLSGSGGAGLYTVGVQQTVGNASNTQSLQAVSQTVLPGSIAGTLLTIAPTGIFNVGQYISGLYNNTSLDGTISSIGPVSSTTATYGISQSLTVGTTLSLMAPPTQAVVLASVGGSLGPTNQMVITSGHGFGSPVQGQQVTGPGITTPTFITSVSGLTCTLSNSFVIASELLTLGLPSGAEFTGSIATSAGISTLTVSSISGGILGIGQVVVGTSLPPTSEVYIQSYAGGGGGTVGGTGQYIVSGSATAGTQNMASFAAPTSFIGTVTGSTTLVVTQPIPANTSYLIGSGIAAGTQLAVTSGTLTVSPPQDFGSPLSPMPITFIGDPLPFAGYIAGSAITSTTGVFAVGQTIYGPNVLPGTFISRAANNTNATVSVNQYLTTNPTIGLVSAGEIVGSIFGTTLVGSVTSGSLSSANKFLSGSTIPIGTSITSSIVSSGSATCALAVPQFQPISTGVTIATAGAVAAASFSESSMTLSADYSGSALSIGEIVSGEDLFEGTNIVSGSSSPFGVTVTQPAGTLTASLYSPIPSSSNTLTPAVIGVRLAAVGPRPGRLFEFNNSSTYSLNQLQCFDTETAVCLVNSTGVRITNVHCDCNPIDLNTTFLDVQGTSSSISVSSVSFVNISNFINNNGGVAATILNSSMSVVNCLGDVGGGYLLSHTGAGMRLSGCSLGSGVISIQSPRPISFSSTEFAPSGVGGATPIFVNGQGSATPVFDLSCFNAP